MKEFFKKWVDLTEFNTAFFKLRLLVLRLFNKFDYDWHSSISGKYNRVFNDMFFDYTLNDGIWRIGQNWGKVHPEYPYQYSDISCVEVNNGLYLINKYLPKDGVQWVGQDKEFEYHADYARGEISTREKFMYGTFEIRCIIPKDENIVTAFWLAGAGEMKEIDGFEFFPKGDSNRWKKQLITIHWADEDGLRRMSPKNYKLPLSITERMNTYTIIWEKDKLEFLFNGVVIRRFTNKKVLATLDKPMNLIISNGLVNKPEHLDTQLANNPLRIDYIQILQKS